MQPAQAGNSQHDPAVADHVYVDLVDWIHAASQALQEYASMRSGDAAV